MQEYLQVFGRAAESVLKSGEIMSVESQQLSAPMASSSWAMIGSRVFIFRCRRAQR